MQIRDEKVTRKVYITCDGRKFTDENQAIQHEYELKRELAQCKDHLVDINSRINMLKDDTLPKEFAKHINLKKMTVKEYREQHKGLKELRHSGFSDNCFKMSYTEAKYAKSRAEYEAYLNLKTSQSMLKDYKREFYATKKRITVLKTLLEKTDDSDSNKKESK